MLTVVDIEGGVGGGVFNSAEAQENADSDDVRQTFHPHLKIRECSLPPNFFSYLCRRCVKTSSV
jgi:hypothetical protein